MNKKRIILASVRGTCAGVSRALEAIDHYLNQYGTVYVTHEPVHNKLVSNELQSRGLVFADNIEQIPVGSVVIFSAHGTPKKTIELAVERGLIVVDAACPLVTKVHREIIRYEKDERKIIIIGNAGHQEIIGLLGQLRFPENAFVIKTSKDVEALPEMNRVAYVTQTTLSVDETQSTIDALKNKFVDIIGPGMSDVCFATKNRQDAVKNLCKIANAILVIGSQNSSNSNHLRSTAQECEAHAWLLDDLSSVNVREMLKDYEVIGVTAGASVPEWVVNKALIILSNAFPEAVFSTMEGVTENVSFPAIC